jgi:hypothetical protein
LHGSQDLGFVVPKQKRAVTHHEINQAVAVNVPLVRALGVCDVWREWLHVAAVVSDTAGDHLPRALVHRQRARESLGKILTDGGRNGGFGHETVSSREFTGYVRLTALYVPSRRS